MLMTASQSKPVNVSLGTTVWSEADTITHIDDSHNTYSGNQDPTRGPPA